MLNKMKNVIEFYSKIDAVFHEFPIEFSGDNIPAWMDLAKADYMNNKNSQSVYKCPGIVELMTSGYIVKTWHDIEVGSDMNGRLIASYPSDELEKLLGFPPVQIQGGDTVAKHVPKRPWSHRDILKINTPWHIVAPKGVKFMMLPVSYTDEIAFESTIGILDPAVSNEINVQGYVNKLGVIRAGTPIAQLIPISERKYDTVIRKMTESDKAWIDRKWFLSHFSFIFNRSRAKKAYEDHYSQQGAKKCPFHNIIGK